MVAAFWSLITSLGGSSIDMTGDGSRDEQLGMSLKEPLDLSRHGEDDAENVDTVRKSWSCCISSTPSSIGDDTD